MPAATPLGRGTDATVGGLRIRSLAAGESWVVLEIFAGLSADSRLRRYHAPIHRLSDPMLERLAAVDGSAHLAMVAEVRGHDGWRPIGVARLVRTAPGEGELAIEVVDRWQGRGVGRQLLEALRDRAAHHRYVAVTGSILVGNEPMLGLLRSVFPGAVVARDERTWEVTAPVPAAHTRRGGPRGPSVARRVLGRVPGRRWGTTPGPRGATTPGRRGGAALAGGLHRDRPRGATRRRRARPAPAITPVGGRVGRPLRAI